MEILNVSNLTKKYGKDENLVKAVDDVSFKVQKGEFVAIVGPSGGGKSTLIHLLGGVDKPDNGKVLIDGENLYGLKGDSLTIFRRKNIGIIYQFYNLIPVLTVKENIILPAVLDGRKIMDDYLEELVKTLDLKERLNYLPNEISGGQQQRCAIGRALINHPKLLLADEPTGNLDSKNTKTVMKLLKYYNETYGQTIIMVTHDLKLAKQASRIITFEDGRIVDDKNGH
ncbi:MAG: ABC transporter ATP-binding protein [Bacilli bacterium]